MALACCVSTDDDDVRALNFPMNPKQDPRYPSLHFKNIGRFWAARERRALDDGNL
jgi:hypothetical protein